MNITKCFEQSKKIVLICSIVGFIFSCKKDITDAPLIVTKLTGKVTDKQTNQPIEGVQVITSPVTSSVSTDNSGTYTIVDIKAGQYVVTGTKSGYKNASISVEVNEGKTATADIQLETIKQELSVSKTEIDLGSTQTTSSFTIINKTSIGTLNFTILKSVDWLSISPTTGSISTGSATIVVSASRANLAYGNFNTIISITSNGGNIEIPVTMIVPNPYLPQLTVSPLLLDFDSSLFVLPFNISNTGNGKLQWSVSSKQPWISFSKTTDSTTTEIDLVNAIVSRSNLQPGNYNGEVEITSNAGTQKIAVKMVVLAIPSLALSTNTVDFDSTKTQLSFNVFNAGSGTLSWSANSNQSWISLSNQSGTNLGTINVTINKTGLNPGNYSGLISINSNGGSGSVTVKMKVAAPPSGIPLTDMTILKNTYTLKPNTIIRGIKYPVAYYFPDEYIYVKLLKEYKIFKMSVGVDDEAGLRGNKIFRVKDDKGNVLIEGKAEPLKDPIIVEVNIRNYDWIEITAVDYNGQPRDFVRWINVYFYK